MSSNQKTLLGQTGQIDLENVPAYIDALRRCNSLLHFLPEEMAEEGREIATQLYWLADELSTAAKMAVPAQNSPRETYSVSFLAEKAARYKKAFIHSTDNSHPVIMFIRGRCDAISIDLGSYEMAFFEGVLLERLGLLEGKKAEIMLL